MNPPTQLPVEIDWDFCSSPIERLVNSAWLGHTPFALFLVQALQPSLVVELGTHTGASYCAFCQAITALQLPARAVAIDTWKGDGHTGAYDDSLFQELQAYHDPRYGSFSTLLRGTFEAALPRFEDGSIDLLHIDGFHTYEAVRHDFETWLPKLSRQGVILFHDTHVRRKDFGVWRLWDELQARYPSFDFEHSFGLGVLAVGDEVPSSLAGMFELDRAERSHVRDLFQQLGRRAETERLRQPGASQSPKKRPRKQRSWIQRLGRLATSPLRMLRQLAR